MGLSNLKVIIAVHEIGEDCWMSRFQDCCGAEDEQVCFRCVEFDREVADFYIQSHHICVVHIKGIQVRESEIQRA